MNMLSLFLIKTNFENEFLLNKIIQRTFVLDIAKSEFSNK